MLHVHHISMRQSSRLELRSAPSNSELELLVYRVRDRNGGPPEWGAVTATSTPFLKLKSLKPIWLSDVTIKDSNLLIMQCSNTFDTSGLMAMPLKSSPVRALL